VTFKGEVYLTHDELKDAVEVEKIVESVLRQLYTPSYLHVSVAPWEGDLPSPSQDDLSAALSTLEKGVVTSPVAEGTLGEPKQGPPVPGALTFTEYYAAFADMTFRALQGLFQDPKNWMHTWRGGWTQIDGSFRSQNMRVPETFGLVLVLGDKALIEVQRRLGDPSALEVIQ